MNDKYDNLWRLENAKGELAYHLHVFGDHISKREGFNAHTGIDAVHYYLVEKYKWKLSDVRSMSSDDLRFLLAEEMHGWVLPEVARPDRS